MEHLSSKAHTGAHRGIEWHTSLDALPSPFLIRVPFLQCYSVVVKSEGASEHLLTINAFRQILRHYTQLRVRFMVYTKTADIETERVYLQ